ncbi:MAG: hypothetical protein GWP59_02990 [Chlamydiales bacterium]|nr:flavin reductase family protein [Chlamydiales bacterium]NCF70650.1 hypothetical protein [Chlamydiales bacterium]
MNQEEDFKQFMRQVPAAVSVITSSDTKGRVAAITISSFTSCSLKPPLFTVNVKSGSYMDEILADAPFAAIHLLSEGQEDLSNHFAKGYKEAEELFKSIDIDYSFNEHLPIIKSCPHYLITKVKDKLQVGDHSIIVLEMVKSKIKDTMAPLIYCNRTYRKLAV